MPSSYLHDLSKLDLGAIRLDRDDITRVIPHRGTMLLIDEILWLDEGLTASVGVKHVRDLSLIHI